MEQRRFREFIEAVIHEIEKHKWYESQKAGRNIGGNAAALDWLEKHYEAWKEAHGLRFLH